MLKKILVGLLVVLVAIQFIRPARNLAPTPGPNDITTRHPVPPEMRRILETSCYDCHSNHTRYPWYAEVQPIGWLLANHIRDGKRHLNFSEFATYPAERAALKLGHVIEEVKGGDMPLESYTWIHRDARLTPEQVQLFVAWAESTRQRLAAPPAAAQP
jgi:hypothetical protein